MEISRFYLPSRRRAHIVPLNEEPQPRVHEQAEDIARQGLDEEPAERVSMGKGHRLFHRRAAQAATQVVTVNVDIVATVDTNGNLLAQETVTSQGQTLATAAAAAAASEPSVEVPAVPAVPSVPAVPTVALPSVPSVPPFPSDLVVPSVPAFPWPSGVSASAAVTAAEAAASASPASSTAAPTSALGTSAVPVPISAVNPISNSTIVSTAALLSISSFTSLESGSLSSSVSATPSPSASLTLSTPESSGLSSRASSSGITTPSVSGSTALASDAAATSYYGGGGGQGNPAAPPASTTTSVTGGDADSSPAPLETPQVVGSIVGSLAGAAFILAIVLLLIRRHKRRRGGALQLTGDDHTDNDQQVMRQVPPRSSLVPSAFLHRFSGMSRSTVETNTSGERSFQRVSGRKLPSAFSEGMTSEQFSRGGTLSGSSFYQDDSGTYGGPGLSKEFGKEVGDNSNVRGSGPMNIRPSPARTPIIRHPDDVPPFGTNQSHLSPPQSPNPDFPSRGTLGRSLHSADGSRSSRFTENV
ncbi:hypothetical protein N0V83_010759 [Neocucurbitaria cava]|uniref:Uncharacterized protein n=1 Tax=Neocucurbitaria cava TaxID=798079 RepID=A0A9W8XXU6_9PLEO|nr:hypothetical protein N0V83_010759 [Neocucurbitaria cava]